MAQAIGTIAAFRGGAQAGRNGQTILARIGEFAAGLAHEWAVRRDVHALESLDGRTLADIGIGRGEVERAVRFGRRAAAGLGPIATPTTARRLVPASFTDWR